MITQHRVLATSALLGGLLGASGVVLYAAGRQKEATVIAVAGAVTSAFLAAIRMIGEEPPPA